MLMFASLQSVVLSSCCFLHGIWIRSTAKSKLVRSQSTHPTASPLRLEQRYGHIAYLRVGTLLWACDLHFLINGFNVIVLHYYRNPNVISR